MVGGWGENLLDKYELCIRFFRSGINIINVGGDNKLSICDTIFLYIIILPEGPGESNRAQKKILFLSHPNSAPSLGDPPPPGPPW